MIAVERRAAVWRRGALPRRGLGLAAVVPLLITASAGPEPTGADLVEVWARTLIIGPEGTRTAARDRALLAPGKSGLLRLELELGAGQEVEVTLEVRYAPAEEEEPEDGKGPGGEARGPAARLSISSSARARPSGEAVLRSSGGVVPLPGSLFHEAFVSGRSGERVVVNLEAAPWSPREELVPESRPATPRPIYYRITVYRSSAEGLEEVGRQALQSLVGRSTSYSFGLLPGEGGDPEVPREAMRLEVRAAELTGGRLLGTVTLTGELGGRPVRASRGWSLRSGGTELLSFDFGLIDGQRRSGSIALQVRF